MANRPRSKPVIGLLGGVGAGKSTVAAALGELGCAVIDGDAIGHELLSDPAVIRQLRKRWGDRIFSTDNATNSVTNDATDDAVDRKALAAIVFEDPHELDSLNAILHPRIRRRIEERIAAIGSDASIPAAVLDAAVLLEAGWDDLCTHLVFVDAPAPDRCRRTVKHRGWDRKMWQDRENSQISLDNKRNRCDYSVNSSSVSRLHKRIRELFQSIVIDADRSS